MEYIKHINFFICKIILFSIITKNILCLNNIYLMEEIKKLIIMEYIKRINFFIRKTVLFIVIKYYYYK